MQLLHIKFRSFPHAAPLNRTSFLMHFQHVPLRFVARITEDALKNHGYIAHQVYRVVVNHHVPRQIERLFCARFFFNRRRTSSGRPRTLWTPNSERSRDDDFCSKWLRAHKKMLTYAAGSSNL